MKTQILKVQLILAALFVTATACPLRAADQTAPKPSPEMKKYEVFLGDWTYEGEAKATAIGKAGKLAGKMTNRMRLDGFVMEGHWKDEINPDMGTMEGLDLHSYDAKKKAFVIQSYDTSGGVGSATETVTGNTWSSSGSFTGPSGEAVKTRSKNVASADGQTVTGTWEISMDEGKTWQTWFAITSKKAKK